MTIPDFPNGFDSWQKTHFEVVEVLVYLRGLDSEKLPKGFSNLLDQSASEELYKLALDLTNRYEAKTTGQQRKRSLFDEIEEFVWNEVNAKTS